MKWILLMAMANHYAYNVRGFNERIECERAGAHEVQTIYAKSDHDKSIEWDWFCMPESFLPPKSE